MIDQNINIKYLRITEKNQNILPISIKSNKYFINFLRNMHFLRQQDFEKI